MSQRRFRVTGHRGAAGVRPENTLSSFEYACDIGVDRVETDVHLTADHHLVCIHDELLDRTTNGTGPVSSRTLEEIRQLDAGHGQRVPTLAEALKTVRGRAVLQVELKGACVEQPVMGELQKIGVGMNEILLSAFEPEKLLTMRALNPDVPVSLLFGEPPRDAVDQAQRVGAGSIAVNQFHIHAGVIDDAHQAGLEIRAWNPDSEDEMQRMIDMGVDGLGSNRPDVLIGLLRRLGLR